MEMRANTPEKGFYYHYKHDLEGPVNNYTYDLVGIGIHTEEDCRPEDAVMVVYRPLYRESAYNDGKLFYLRPLEMWMENVSKDGKTFLRFQKITDPSVISELEKIKAQMYGV